MYKPLFLSILTLLCACIARESPPAHVRNPKLPTITIHNDEGGAVEEYARRIATYNPQTIVRITGFCASACTMYLIFKNACTTPETIFKFHGPGSETYGIPLSPSLFESSSREMADYYPEPIRSWFMRKGRYSITDTFDYSGEELIAKSVIDAC